MARILATKRASLPCLLSSLLSVQAPYYGHDLNVEKWGPPRLFGSKEPNFGLFALKETTPPPSGAGGRRRVAGRLVGRAGLAGLGWLGWLAGLEGWLEQPKMT